MARRSVESSNCRTVRPLDYFPISTIRQFHSSTILRPLNYNPILTILQFDSSTVLREPPSGGEQSPQLPRLNLFSIKLPASGGKRIPLYLPRAAFAALSLPGAMLLCPLRGFFLLRLWFKAWKLTLPPPAGGSRGTEEQKNRGMSKGEY